MEYFNNGVCKYCGQILANINGFTTQQEADENAILNCDCGGATRYKILKRAEQNIQSVFGDNAEEYGKEPIEETVQDMLLELCERVYDGHIKSVSLGVETTQGTAKANIKQNTDGAIVISRTDTSKMQKTV